MILYPGSMESFSIEAMCLHWRNKYDAYKYLFLGHYYELLEDAGYTNMNMDLDSFTITLFPKNDEYARLHISISYEHMVKDKIFTVFIDSSDGFTLDNQFAKVKELIRNPDAIPVLDMVRRCEKRDYGKNRGI